MKEYPSGIAVRR